LGCTVLAVVLLLSVTNVALAHGVGYRESSKRPVSLEFYFSNGEAMSFQETQVFSPLDERFSFQSGRTDEFGRFAFTPDHPGQWRVIVRDDEGHRAEAVVDITEDFFEEGESVSASPIRNSNLIEGTELLVRAVLGVSLLFNVAAGVTIKRRAARKKSGGE
jgi:nickel transport protein